MVHGTLPYISINTMVSGVPRVYQDKDSDRLLWYTYGTPKNHTTQDFKYSVPRTTNNIEMFLHEYVTYRKLGLFIPIEEVTRDECVSENFTKKKVKETWNIDELEQFFNKIKISIQEIQLDQCTYITNIKQFVDSHIVITNHNNGNPTYKPYYNRLVKLQNKLKK